MAEDHGAPKAGQLPMVWSTGRRARQSRLCQKEKSHLSTSPDRKVEESQGEREPHLGQKKRDHSRTMERKGWTPRRQISRKRNKGKQREPP